jgi:pimeloyl-ACP methyl ester carboxylesterase
MHRLQTPHDAEPTTTGFTLLQRPATGTGSLGCWLALPATMTGAATPLVAVHGIRRGARQQAELLGERAAALGRPVIAPLFDEHNWPRYQRVVHRGRADLALLALMRELRLSGVWGGSRFELSGYSGGAQFAHRFAMLYPQLISRLTVVAAGWYTFPDTAPYPRGLAVRPDRRDDWGPRLAAGLDRFLRLPIRVCVGDRDCIPDRNTRAGEAIETHQGIDRKTRAHRWADALRAAAEARGVTPDLRFHVLPDCGHDFGDCVHNGHLDRVILGAGEAISPPGQLRRTAATERVRSAA